MRLKTDYTQWYDGLFDGTGPELERMAFTRGGLAKREQFALFEHLGLATPRHGLVRELGSQLPSPAAWNDPRSAWLPEVHCVVYLDEISHAGEGKVRLSFSEALARFPEHYASLYFPPAGPPVNLRHARFGHRGFWLRQQGTADDWRSNRRDRETVVAESLLPPCPLIRRVLWAIDFIPTPAGLLAVDFNTAPDLNTLWETGRLTAAAALAELEHAALDQPETLRQR